MNNNLFNNYYAQKSPNFILENLPESGLKNQDLREFTKYLATSPASLSDDEQKALKKLINLFIDDNLDENYNHLSAYGSMSFLGFCMVFTALNKENLDNLFYNHNLTLNLKNEERLYLMTYLSGLDMRKNQFSNDPKRISFSQKQNALNNILHLEEYKFKPIAGKTKNKVDLYQAYVNFSSQNEDVEKCFKKLINIDFKKDADYTCYSHITALKCDGLINIYSKVKQDISDLFAHFKNELHFSGYNEMVIKHQKYFDDIPDVVDQRKDVSDIQKQMDYVKNKLFTYLLDYKTGYTEEDNINLAVDLTKRLRVFSLEENLDLGDYFNLYADGHIDRLYDQMTSSGYANTTLQEFSSSFDPVINVMSNYFYTFIEKRDLMKTLEQNDNGLASTKRRI